MSTHQKHALVTGGAGLIGSHIADLLLSEGWTVRVVPNLYPALTPAGEDDHEEPPTHRDARSELFSSLPASGSHEVIINGPQSVLSLAELPLARLGWRGGGIVGLAQGAALLPGISRSGSAIVAGLLLRLDHDDAARYSFLLATPVIFAASALEVPKLFAPYASAVLAQAGVGGVLAALTAYASIAFLTRWFHSHDLRPFGWYCLIFGAACLALALAKVIS